MGYDPMGRRTSLSKGSQNKSFFYLGQSLLSDGTSKFLHGSGIDQPLQLENSTGSLSYLSDHLGSTSQLLDGNGTRKARYDYQSYGKLEGNSSNPLASNPFTYTAREDDGTGLLYYRARYYNPELEVFISQDPLGDAQRYVSGNPLRFVDPLGLWGLGISFGGSAEAGQPIVGAGITGSMGSALFTGKDFSAPSIGGFASGGAFVGGMVRSLNAPAAKTPGSVIGAYAGAGVGLLLTNADTAEQLSGCAHTGTINIGLGLVKGTIQFSIGNNGIGSLTIAPDFGWTGMGLGASLSEYDTYTGAKSWNLHPQF